MVLKELAKDWWDMTRDGALGFVLGMIILAGVLSLIALPFFLYWDITTCEERGPEHLVNTWYPCGNGQVCPGVTMQRDCIKRR